MSALEVSPFHGIALYKIDLLPYSTLLSFVVQDMQRGLTGTKAEAAATCSVCLPTRSGKTSSLEIRLTWERYTE